MLVSYQLKNSSGIIKVFLLGFLVFTLMIGAGYRLLVLEKEYKIIDGFGVFLSLASNFQKTAGLYSHEESLAIEKNPDGYVYTTGGSAFEPTGPIENELGWPFMLSLILKSGMKGVGSIALTIARYQIMMDIFVIIVLFWSGWKIAGAWGAALTAFLYATFEMPMFVMSWVRYYYWTIPFSALSIFFWTNVYDPKEARSNKPIFFFLYGILLGLVGFIRLNFMFLSMFVFPVLLFREKTLRRSIFLFLIILSGQMVFLLPQLIGTKMHHNKYALTTRGAWHGIIQGAGAYPNPWGIRDSSDEALLVWVKERGGPDLNKEGLSAYEDFCKKEAFKMIKERPGIFLNNALKNFSQGITISPHYFRFFGPFERILRERTVNKFLPVTIISSLIILFVTARERFWLMLTAVLQGLYLLFVVVPYFPPYIPWVAGYIPVFVLLLSSSVVVNAKFIFKIISPSAQFFLRKKYPNS